MTPLKSNRYIHIDTHIYIGVGYSPLPWVSYSYQSQTTGIDRNWIPISIPKANIKGSQRLIEKIFTKFLPKNEYCFINCQDLTKNMKKCVEMKIKEHTRACLHNTRPYIKETKLLERHTARTHRHVLHLKNVRRIHGQNTRPCVITKEVTKERTAGIHSRVL